MFTVLQLETFILNSAEARWPEVGLVSAGSRYLKNTKEKEEKQPLPRRTRVVCLFFLSKGIPHKENAETQEGN